VLEKLNLGKQGADLCSSPMTQLFVAAYFAERAADGRPAWIEYVERLRGLYRRRRDVMLESLAEHFGGRASWTRPEGGLFIWATLDGVDTTDLMGRSKGVAFVPGRSAYMDVDGRSGASSMRLNFAGVPDEDIREGIRRISAIARPDTGLMGMLTGSSAQTTPGGAEAEGGAAVSGDAEAADAADSDPGETRRDATDSSGSAEREAGLADVVELPRREVSDSARPSPSRRRQDR
jgi:2-aminoadipate transaminase